MRLRALLSAARVAPAALAVLGACGGPSNPPLVQDVLPQQDSGPPSLISDAGPVIQNCGVGPDGGVCACADEPLEVDPPSLYYVLDRSGSMADNGKWNTVRSVLGSLAIALGPRARFAAAVFPDTQQEGCTPGGQVFPTQNGQPLAPLQGDGMPGAPGPHDLALIQTLGLIGASGGTPTAATLQALLPVVKGFGGRTYVVLATDGGPNCNPNAVCTAATCTYNIENDLGCAPAGPSCCAADAGIGGPNA